ncbi:MAG TPA: methionyl-tRNA formyltransferase [Bacteroidia bacterium]|jgi:methionyl-tRNA formyltransferase|nr:methionyl-tRNA formyltransferase [Bacteroidia bacterium]
MRIVFMGTPAFAVASLEILVKNNYNIVGVVTSPDKPAGRGQQLQQSAVKQFAVTHNLKVLQPANLKEESFIKELKELNADLQVVVAFRMLPETVWNMPKMGTYNLHGSLLPHYRGAAPINWAIINGDKETGVTTFKLKHEIDTGSILLQDKITITEEMNAGQLHDVMMMKGAELLLRSVKIIEEGNVVLKEQNALLKPGEEIRHAPKIFKENCKIDWTRTGVEINNLIRGLSPYPCAWTELHDGDKKTAFKIYSVVFENSNHQLKPSAVQCDGKKSLKIACADGFIHITELQMEGKKRMSTEEFLRGYTFADNTQFI